MSRVTDIADDAILMVGNNLYWMATHGAISLWGKSQEGYQDINTLGHFEERAFNCYSFPFWLAAKRGYMNRQDAIAWNNTLMRIGTGDKKALAFNTQTPKPQIKRYWGFGWATSHHPAKGDIVFFKDYVGGITAHVAIATGELDVNKSSQVVTFGEGAMAAGQVQIHLRSIDFIKKSYKYGQKGVYFLTPYWN